MTRLIILLGCLTALLSGSVKASAQTGDAEAVSYISSSDYFSLRDLYETRGETLSPFIQSFSRVMVNQAFGSPTETLESIDDLFGKYQDNLDFGTIVSLLYFKAADLSLLGKNAEAVTVLDNFISQIESQVDKNVYQPLITLRDQYKVMSGYDTNRFTAPADGDLKIPFRLKPIGSETGKSDHIVIAGQVNDEAVDITFDTGAGANVISTELAGKLGLELPEVSVNTVGVGSAAAQFVVIDKLSLGEDVVIENVPFLVMDITSGNAEADQYLKDMQCIIGLGVIRTLGEIRIDFKQGKIVVPEVQTQSDARNLAIDPSRQSLSLMAYSGDERLLLLPDTGAGAGLELFGNYFKAHSDAITSNGEETTQRVAGIGGISTSKAYKLKDFDLKVGNTVTTLPSVTVGTEEDLDLGNSYDGNLGIDYFKRFATVIINTDKMFLEVHSRK